MRRIAASLVIIILLVVVPSYAARAVLVGSGLEALELVSGIIRDNTLQYDNNVEKISLLDEYTVESTAYDYEEKANYPLNLYLVRVYFSFINDITRKQHFVDLGIDEEEGTIFYKTTINGEASFVSLGTQD
jgi:hypothetical protein